MPRRERAGSPASHWAHLPETLVAAERLKSGAKVETGTFVPGG